MDQNAINSHLSGKQPPLETLKFLSAEFIPAVIAEMNKPGTRRRMALYGGDRVPENERNLTDVRNRMSLLIEYKLAWISNDILESHGISDLFWTNVVANRFPDLEIRTNNGKRGLRIEVKCLQGIAEEKAANFDTLKKDVSPLTDYIVVFVWDWFNDVASVVWDRAPKIVHGFVFHAASLAELRDYKWLNDPPPNLGDGVQGYDLRYAVNCRNGVYNEEEGNYGKLWRIWSDSIIYTPGLTPLLQKTVDDYLEFAEFIVWIGFSIHAQALLTGRPHEIVALSEGGKPPVGYSSGNLGLLLKRKVGTMQEQLSVASRFGLHRLIVLNDKYQWSDNTIENGRLVRVTKGRKPKHLALHLSES